MNHWRTGMALPLVVILTHTFAASAQSPNVAAPAPGSTGVWRVEQRALGCEIIQPGITPTTETARLRRPFRGASFMTIDVGLRTGQPPSIGEARAILRLPNGVNSTIDMSWRVVLDQKTLEPTSQSALVILDKKMLPNFVDALSGTGVAVVEIEGRRFELPLPSGEAWRQADQCVTRVGEALRTASPPAGPDGAPPDRKMPILAGSFGNAFSADAYPKEALAQKAEGRARAALTVDEYGYPTTCRIVQSSGHKVLDDRTCDMLLRQTHYFPALNSANVATEGVIEKGINWKLP